MNLREILEVCVDAGLQTDQIIASGGATKEPLLAAAAGRRARPRGRHRHRRVRGRRVRRGAGGRRRRRASGRTSRRRSGRSRSSGRSPRPRVGRSATTRCSRRTAGCTARSPRSTRWWRPPAAAAAETAASATGPPTRDPRHRVRPRRHAGRLARRHRAGHEPRVRRAVAAAGDGGAGAAGLGQRGAGAGAPLRARGRARAHRRRVRARRLPRSTRRRTPPTPRRTRASTPTPGRRCRRCTTPGSRSASARTRRPSWRGRCCARSASTGRDRSCAGATRRGIRSPTRGTAGDRGGARAVHRRDRLRRGQPGGPGGRPRRGRAYRHVAWGEPVPDDVARLERFAELRGRAVDGLTRRTGRSRRWGSPPSSAT